jgi:hypothetical protein
VFDVDCKGPERLLHAAIELNTPENFGDHEAHDFQPLSCNEDLDTAASSATVEVVTLPQSETALSNAVRDATGDCIALMNTTFINSAAKKNATRRLAESW